jgi:hypothetical protein
MVPTGALFNLDACSKRAKEEIAELGEPQHHKQ